MSKPFLVLMTTFMHYTNSDFSRAWPYAIVSDDTIQPFSLYDKVESSPIAAMSLEFKSILFTTKYVIGFSLLAKSIHLYSSHAAAFKLWISSGLLALDCSGFSQSKVACEDIASEGKTCTALDCSGLLQGKVHDYFLGA
ncbi:hypothetical protein GOP47_0031140 [Adiantum capillus-veneris]|nr:hypothetical protein GOP47_0031140 [Adiantum capillus-veneris]